MAETAIESTLEVDFDENVEEYTSESEYTTESLAGRFGEAVPGAGLGRRKEAIARVRIVPGTASGRSTVAPWRTTSPTRCTSRP